MKNTLRSIPATALLTLAASPVWAASTTTVYSSGILVLAFLGVCALIVLSQLIPALLVLAGLVKEFITGARAKDTVTETADK